MEHSSWGYAIGGHEHVLSACQQAEQVGKVAYMGAAMVEYPDTGGAMVEAPRMIAVIVGQGEDPVPRFDELGRGRTAQHPRIHALMFGKPHDGVAVSVELPPAA